MSDDDSETNGKGKPNFWIQQRKTLTFIVKKELEHSDPKLGVAFHFLFRIILNGILLSHPCPHSLSSQFWSPYQQTVPSEDVRRKYMVY
jgi:hypothetical protein